VLILKKFRPMLTLKSFLQRIFLLLITLKK